jgi:hypothetical protein
LVPDLAGGEQSSNSDAFPTPQQRRSLYESRFPVFLGSMTRPKLTPEERRERANAARCPARPAFANGGIASKYTG